MSINIVTGSMILRCTELSISPGDLGNGLPDLDEIRIAARKYPPERSYRGGLVHATIKIVLDVNENLGYFR